MPFWKCYYHIVWATKGRQPIITSTHEHIIFESIKVKSAELRAPLLAISAVSDHLHTAVCIPPSMQVSHWVGMVKGVSARAVNTSQISDAHFSWQEGYGVMSFGETALAMVLGYIASQKEHHAQASTNPYLERIDE